MEVDRALVPTVPFADQGLPLTVKPVWLIMEDVLGQALAYPVLA